MSCSGLALAEAVGVAAAVVVLLHEDAAAGPEMGMDAKPLLIAGQEAFWKPLWLGPCPPTSSLSWMETLSPIHAAFKGLLSEPGSWANPSQILA